MQSDQLNVSVPMRVILLQKEMVVIFVAAFIVMINVYNSLTLIPLYVTDVGGSEFAAGVQSTIFTLATVILRFYLGPMADTRGRKVPLLIGSFVFMTAPVLIWFSPNLWFQGLVRVYHAIGMATFLSSASSLVADMTPQHLRGTVMGIYRMIVVLALMVGPPLGMKTVSNWGYEYFFWGSAVLGLIPFLLLTLLPKTLDVSSKAQKVTLQHMWAMLKDHILLTAYTGVAVISICYGVLMTFVPIYTIDYAHLVNPGIYFTIFAGAGALATVAGGYLSDRLARIRVVLPAVVSLGLGLILLALMPISPGLLLILSALFCGTGFSAALSTLIAWVVDRASEDLRGTALALQENAIDGAIAVSAFIFGLGTVAFDFPVLFIILGLLTCLSPRLITGFMKN